MSPIIEGPVEEHTVRGEWHSFRIGNRRVSTKQKDIADQAASLLGQMVQADIVEYESDKINEHTGLPFTNRYLNSIVPATTAAPPSSGAPSPASQPGPEPTRAQLSPAPTPSTAPPPAVEERELRIMRQSAAKVAVEILRPEERNVGHVIVVAEELLRYFRGGPQAVDESIPF